MKISLHSADANDPEVIDFRETLNALAQEIGCSLSIGEPEDSASVSICYVISQFLVRNSQQDDSWFYEWSALASKEKPESLAARRLAYYQQNRKSFRDVRSAHDQLLVNGNGFDLVYAGHDGLRTDDETATSQQIAQELKVPKVIVSTDDRKDEKLREFLNDLAPVECTVGNLQGYLFFLFGWVPLIAFLTVVLPHTQWAYYSSGMMGRMFGQKNGLYYQIFGKIAVENLRPADAFCLALAVACGAWLFVWLLGRRLSILRQYPGDGQRRNLKLERIDGVVFESTIDVYRPVVASLLAVSWIDSDSKNQVGRPRGRGCALISKSDHISFSGNNEASPFREKAVGKLPQMIEIGLAVFTALLAVIASLSTLMLLLGIR